MRTVVNKLVKPLRVPLPQGKILHLGPKQRGQIADQAVDHEPLKALVDDGSIEILAGGTKAAQRENDHEHSPAPHEKTHGFQSRGGGVRGDR